MPEQDGLAQLEAALSGDERTRLDSVAAALVLKSEEIRDRMRAAHATELADIRESIARLHGQLSHAPPRSAAHRYFAHTPGPPSSGGSKNRRWVSRHTRCTVPGPTTE